MDSSQSKAQNNVPIECNCELRTYGLYKKTFKQAKQNNNIKMKEMWKSAEQWVETTMRWSARIVKTVLRWDDIHKMRAHEPYVSVGLCVCGSTSGNLSILYYATLPCIGTHTIMAMEQQQQQHPNEQQSAGCSNNRGRTHTTTTSKNELNMANKSICMKEEKKKNASNFIFSIYILCKTIFNLLCTTVVQCASLSLSLSLYLARLCRHEQFFLANIAACATATYSLRQPTTVWSILLALWLRFHFPFVCWQRRRFAIRIANKCPPPKLEQQKRPAVLMCARKTKCISNNGRFPAFQSPKQFSNDESGCQRCTAIYANCSGMSVSVSESITKKNQN